MKEKGFAICRKSNGKLVKGKTAAGDRRSVHISVKCPNGSRLAALHHTHPSGALYPSQQDMQTSARFHVPVCIRAKGKVKCFQSKGNLQE